MSYPPQFSSTKKYEQRLDLDKIDVFFEGDGSESMFFNVKKLPEIAGFSKYYFTISATDNYTLPYKIKDGAEVLFEFKSINDVVVFSDITDYDDHNATALCFVDVKEDPMRTFKDIHDGVGSFIIATELEVNPEYRGTDAFIPSEWEGVINYKCIYPFEIRKTLTHTNSGQILSPKHVSKSFIGPFSFAPASLSQRHSVSTGYHYNDDGNAILQDYATAGDGSD